MSIAAGPANSNELLFARHCEPGWLRSLISGLVCHILAWRRRHDVVVTAGVNDGAQHPAEPGPAEQGSERGHAERGSEAGTGRHPDGQNKPGDDEAGDDRALHGGPPDSLHVVVKERSTCSDVHRPALLADVSSPRRGAAGSRWSSRCDELGVVRGGMPHAGARCSAAPDGWGVLSSTVY